MSSLKSRYLALALLIVSGANCFSQDTISLKNGSRLIAYIQEVSSDGYTYKAKDSYSQDSLLSLDRKNVYAVSYHSGYREFLTPKKSDSLFLMRQTVITGYVGEVEDDTVHLTTTDLKSVTVSKKEIIKIVYASSFVENYNPEPKKETSAAKDKLSEKIQPAVAVLSATAVVSSAPTAMPTKETKLPKETKPTKAEESASAFVVSQHAVYSEDSLKSIHVFKYIPLANLDSVESLDLSNQNVSDLDPNVPLMKKLLILDLSGNKFGEVPSAVFDVKNLYQLIMDNGIIKDIGNIPEKVDLNDLAILSFTRNKITSVDGNLFRLPNLQSVDLSNNLIKSIHNVNKKVMLNPNIRSIQLSNNHLQEIPPVVLRITNLRELDLSYNDIRGIDFADFTLKKLRSLNLSFNLISSLGEPFYDMNELEKLDLRGTGIQELSDSIRKFENLAFLYLPQSLSSLPKGLKYNINLKGLTVTDNPKLSSFPVLLLDLSRLESLDLNGCHIMSIPEEIGQLKRLKNLNFSNCGLTDLPGTLFTLTRLKRIDLSQNNIRSISGKLGSLAQLEYVNLENSPVEEESLLKLKKAVPYATIKYYSAELQVNYESKPVAQEDQEMFSGLLAECDKGNANAFYQLGDFFENRSDYGYALSVYYKLAYHIAPEGSAQHALAALKIADIYDDVDNKRNYTSIYKRKNFSDYSGYLGSLENNKALTIYCQVCQENAADPIAYSEMKKACAKAALIYTATYKQLKVVYDFNTSEITRLINASGNMDNVTANGNYMANTATTSGQAALGTAFALFGSIAKTAKDSKSERLQRENDQLRNTLSDLQAKAEYYSNLKP